MNWLIFVLLLPHFKPKCVNHMYPTLGLAIDALRVVSLLVVAALYIRAFVKEKKLPSIPVWVLGALEVWLCLVTLLNRGDYVQVFSLAVSVMGLALLVDFYADKMKELLGALMLNFEWSVYANLYTVIRWPDQGLLYDMEYGGVPIFFFGPDNWFMYLCIPAVCVALLYLRQRWAGGRRSLHIARAACLIAASYACVLLQWPATAVVAMAGFAVVFLLSLIPGVRRCVSYPVVLAGGVAANLAIMHYRVMDTVPFITDFIQNVLKKDTSLSGRTPLWDSFGTLLDGRLLTGIGMPVGGYPTELRNFDHMHNVILDLLLQGGIPALLLFAAVLVLVGIPLTRGARTLSARIMTAALASLLIMCIPEVCRHQLIYLLLPLAWHAGKLEDACLPPSPPPEVKEE